MPQVEAVRQQRKAVQLSMQQKAFHLERLLALEAALEEEAKLMRSLNQYTSSGGDDANVTVDADDAQLRSAHVPGQLR